MPEMEWRAPEFEFRPKSVSWYWMSIIIATACIGVAVWQNNFLFGLFIVVGEILILVWANREPATISFRASERGLTVGASASYAWGDVQDFSFDEAPHAGWPILTFRLRNRLRPSLRVRVERARASEILQFLDREIPRVEHDQSFLDVLEDFFGF